MMLLVIAVICVFLFFITIYPCMPHEMSKIVEHLHFLISFDLTGVISIIDDIYHAKYNKSDLPSMPGKVAIVTGGSRGLGKHTVKKLLQCDMEVIIACRTPTAGEKAIHEIRESGVKSGRAKVYKLDNSSLESVREFAQCIKRDYDEIHILINNAGIMATPYQETEDGFEEQWQINYLSHFLLTSLLLPLLNAGGRPNDYSRIINITSCTHFAGTLHLDDVNRKNSYIPKAAYAQSKLAQVMFTIILQKFLTDKALNMHVYSVHPGVVKTEIFNTTYVGKLQWLMSLLMKDLEQGVIPVLYTAVNKDIEKKGGIYISNCEKRSVLPAALDLKIQNQLFELSVKQAQLDNFFQYLK